MKIRLGYKELKEFAKRDATNSDSLADIQNEQITREQLWISAFICGAGWMKELYDGALDKVFKTDMEIENDLP